MEYEERYCAFIDVLGFSELIGTIQNSKTLRDRTKNFHEVRSLLQAVHSPPVGPNPPEEDTEFRAQSISDAVAVSTAVNPFGLLLMFNSLETLAIELLCKGFFVRGAIVKGPLYHDKQMIFGEALINAYRLENSVVRYPRIMVSKSVESDLQVHADRVQKNMPQKLVFDLFNNRVLQAEDGPYFLHVLRRVVEAVKRDDWPILKEWSELRKQIVRRFEESADNPNHFEKAQWFARYWNDTMAGMNITEFHRISGAGLDQKPAVWG